MVKRLSREEKKQKMVVDMINKMFEIAGHNVTYDNIKDRKDDWYSQWTMTMEQNGEWVDWGKKYLKETFKWNKKVCEREMAMINLMWGLKYSNYEG